MMTLSLVAMTGLEKCCITSASAYLQWLFHSGERAIASGPLVLFFLENCQIKCKVIFSEKQKNEKIFLCFYAPAC